MQQLHNKKILNLYQLAQMSKYIKNDYSFIFFFQSGPLRSEQKWGHEVQIFI